MTATTTAPLTAEAKLEIISEKFHPTGWRQVGSKTHGGPPEYGYVCERHGYCQEWSYLNPALTRYILDNQTWEPRELRAKLLEEFASTGVAPKGD